MKIRQTVPSLLLGEVWTNGGLTCSPYSVFFSYLVKTFKNSQLISLDKVGRRTQHELSVIHLCVTENM